MPAGRSTTSTQYYVEPLRPSDGSTAHRQISTAMLGAFFTKMLNKERFGTTLPRAIVIAVATILVGILLICFMFLSSGSESGLIPPWQLFMAEAVCVAIMLLLSLKFMSSKKDSSIFIAAVSIVAVLTIVVAYSWGVGAGPNQVASRPCAMSPGQPSRAGYFTASNATAVRTRISRLTSWADRSVTYV